MTTPQHILKHTFGYDHFRGQQETIIQTLINGQDALVLMPTGGGKSLCYQIPALLRAGTGIVISPLIALMQDQVDALTQLGIRASFLNSSLSREQVYATERALFSGGIDLLYIAPERLTQERTLQLLKQIPISLFAIDEAHCVSQWGHDFRADYLQLSLLHEHFPQIPRVALTATADSRTRNEIIQRLQLQSAQQFTSSFDRPNIQYRITPKTSPRKQLLHFLRTEHPSDSGIVYCLSRSKVDDTAAWLSSEGFTALPYHAGQTQEMRALHQKRFLVEENIIIVATIAFGMGINKPDVRFVAHLDLPKSLEAYYQETGRAGRDGKPATAWLAYGLQDVIKLRQMLEGSQGSEQHKRVERHKLDAMLGLCEITSCRRHALLHYFGETPADLDGTTASSDQTPTSIGKAPLIAAHAQGCGNCDNCLNPVRTFDATIPTQKLLSCIYRTGQRFGSQHLVDVLRGESTEKISQFRHEQLSTYGIGKELDKTQWLSILRQLTARGYLNVDMEGFGALQLTERCRPVLRSEERILLREEIPQPKASSRHKQTGNSLAKRVAEANIAEADLPLWEALRGCRRKLAEQQKVPPYVIFHDSTLLNMLEQRPRTLTEMRELSGVGVTKLERYGDAFLEVLREY
ncbi:ATP-dependent DNA helicase [gamma proteobacterium HdN1]|nr:ATP-dependent DNA helicase [gamma proteobacterium HdN1]